MIEERSHALETLEGFEEVYETIPQDLQHLICIHRGVATTEHEENTASAISCGLEYNPYYIEFDVLYVDGSFRQGHPPHVIDGPDGDLRKTLSHFALHASSSQESQKNKRITFPKIDLRIDVENNNENTIRDLLHLLQQPEYTSIPQFLLNINATKNFSNRGEVIIKAQSDFVQQAYSSDLGERLKLNVDIAKYSSLVRGGIVDHIQSLAPFVLSISPEIKESDLDDVVTLAQETQIPEIHFWLYGAPDRPHNHISVTELQAAYTRVRPHVKAVYFDISPTAIW